MTDFRLKIADWIALAVLLALLSMFLRHATPTLLTFLVTLAFAVVGWLLRGVSASGAVAGWSMAFILYSAGTWRMFLVLLAVFVVTLGATLAGRRRKVARGIAESPRGRTASQVGANLVVSTAAMVLLPEGYAAAVALAGLCEAAADTVSSEVGKAFGGKTYLALDLKRVAPGTNGGLSIAGSTAGVLSSAAIASAGILVMDARFVIAAFIAGVFGTLVDSLLGASLEEDGYIGNDIVNLLGTGSAAAVAWFICRT
jgi:uncharacterized protein (TIGR00297 family)